MANILYAEDMDMVRDSTRDLLQQFGNHHVTDVVDAEAGMQLFAQQPFNLVLTDYNMGKGKPDGVDFARHIRQTNPTIPIILLSGKDEEDIREEHSDYDSLNIKYISKDNLRNLLELIKSSLHVHAKADFGPTA